MANTKKTTTATKTTTKRTTEPKEPKPVEEKIEAKEPTAEEIAAVMKTETAQAMIAKMIAEALAKQPQQNFIAVPMKEETVTLVYMGVVPEGTTISLGELGEMQGRGGTRDIPKKEFFNKLTDPILRRLKDRRLVVVDGFTDDERERYGVKYTDGELLSANIYQKLFALTDDEICNVFDKACPRHKEIIATMFIDAYMDENKRVTQSLVTKLNTLSKKADPDGMFRSILKDMAADLSES